MIMFKRKNQVLISALSRYDVSKSMVLYSRRNFYYSDIVSVNKRITECSKAGDLVTARKVFDEMHVRDVVSWNSIMAAYSHNFRFDLVIKLFSDMLRNGFVPNYTSFSTVLSACANLKAFNQGKQIHGFLIKVCSVSNVFVGTSLVKLYSNCKKFYSLTRIFEEINSPSIASYNALISGLILNHRVRDARNVFDKMPMRNVVTWTAMVKGYIEVNNLETAFELFNLMPVKNAVSWCVMIGGFVSNENFEDAVKLFVEMTRCGNKATDMILTKVINAISGLKNAKMGRTIHSHSIKLGLTHDHIIEASLVSMYCECLEIVEAKLEFNKMENKYIGSWNILINSFIKQRKINEARTVFDSMIKRDEITWNLIINGYLKENLMDYALAVFEEMPEPTLETITNIMSGFIENGLLKDAENLFFSLPNLDLTARTTMLYGYLKEGLLKNAHNVFDEMPEKNVVTYNVMISGLFKLEKINEAYKVFNECKERDETTWSILIIGLIQNGLINDAFLNFQKMIFFNFRSNESIIASLISGSTKMHKLINGKQFHTLGFKLGFDLSLLVQNSLVNLYSKFGEMRLSRKIFDGMINKDIISWNSMIFGYAINSKGKEAIQIFEEMKKESIKPDNITFLGLLYACTHSNLSKEAIIVFDSMKKDFRVEPELAHYSCMIEFLNKKGLVKEVENLIESMPFKPDSKTWTSIMNGCEMNHEKSFDLVLNYEKLNGIQVFKGRIGKIKNKPGLSWI